MQISPKSRSVPGPTDLSHISETVKGGSNPNAADRDDKVAHIQNSSAEDLKRKVLTVKQT